jgi:membrane dipeptidase
MVLKKPGPWSRERWMRRQGGIATLISKRAEDSEDFSSMFFLFDVVPNGVPLRVSVSTMVLSRLATEAKASKQRGGPGEPIMNRRNFLGQSAKGAAAAVLVPALARAKTGAAFLNSGRYRLFAGAEQTYSARAIELVQRTTVIDMLAPLWISPSRTMKMLGNPENFTAEDYAPFKQSGISVFHIAIGTGGPEAYLETLQFLSGYNTFLARHDNWFERVETPARLDGIKASGKVGIMLGVQNSEHFRKVDDVDYFYGLGQRVSQLTYNARTLIGNGSTERRDEGLSDYGLAIVERMNKLGMAVDVSHCGDRTTLDAFEVSKKPVLITHSNCRALNPTHPRCKTDEAIKAMAAKGGVMGITEVRMFITAKEPTTIETMLDHFDYVTKLVGVEHLGVGSDIDLLGYDAMPPEELKQLKASYKGSYGFRDKVDIDGYNFAKRPFDLAEGLIRRKYSDGDIEAILGGNFRRVLKQIWTV